MAVLGNILNESNVQVFRMATSNDMNIHFK